MLERTFMNTKCLSSHVLDLDLKMQQHCSNIFRHFFSLLHHHGGFGVVVGVFLQEQQVLQCKSTNSNASKFSQYPTQQIQRKAKDWAQALEG